MKVTLRGMAPTSLATFAARAGSYVLSRAVARKACDGLPTSPGEPYAWEMSCGDTGPSPAERPRIAVKELV